MRWKHEQPRLLVPCACCLLIFDVSSFNLDYPKKSLENLYRQVGHWLAIDKKVTRRTAVMCNIGPDMCTLCSSAACAKPMQHRHWQCLTWPVSCTWPFLPLNDPVWQIYFPNNPFSIQLLHHQNPLHLLPSVVDWWTMVELDGAASDLLSQFIDRFVWLEIYILFGANRAS